MRALNATKLERVFAKPFLGSLDGHKDGVHCLLKHPSSLSLLLSGACDGEVCGAKAVHIRDRQRHGKSDTTSLRITEKCTCLIRPVLSNY